jgi:hypothetical protein
MIRFLLFKLFVKFLIQRYEIEIDLIIVQRDENGVSPYGLGYCEKFPKRLDLERGENFFDSEKSPAVLCELCMKKISRKDREEKFLAKTAKKKLSQRPQRKNFRKDCEEIQTSLRA